MWIHLHFSNFNPRSPRGERHRVLGKAAPTRIISIHAPREGSDMIAFDLLWQVLISIHAPREGSDLPGDYCNDHFDISIHAPREGSDIRLFDLFGDLPYFNPRSPRGERLHNISGWSHPIYNFNPRSPRGERRSWRSLQATFSDFNPRSPRGERPRARCKILERGGISIHAPREGSDLILW